MNIKDLELIKTKKISKQDIERIVELTLSGIGTYTKTYLLKHSKTKSISSKHNNFIILKDNTSSGNSSNNIIGFAMYRIDKELVFIYEIHVDPLYRHKGIGSRTMRELISDEINKTIILFVHKKNKIGQEFYEKIGFKYDNSYENRNYLKMEYLSK